MNKKNEFERPTIFILFLVLFTSLLSTSVLAQIFLTPETILIYWAFISPFILVLIYSMYVVWKASKSYGGKIGIGLKKLSIGINLSYLTTISIGVFSTLEQLGKWYPILWLIAIIFAILTYYYILKGSNSIINSAN